MVCNAYISPAFASDLATKYVCLAYTRNAKALSVPSDYRQVTNIVYGTLVRSPHICNSALSIFCGYLPSILHQNLYQ
jgi:hypothetical protein